MKISKTNFITAHYRLKEENAEGKLIEETYERGPLDFVYGVGMMIPGFEVEIEGLSKGDKKGFAVKAEDAYGLYDDNNVIPIPLENFGTDEERAEHLIIGNNITLQDGEGRSHMGKVHEILDDTVRIDFNHPMAGNDLFFEVEIMNIRETSKEELDKMGVVFEG